MTIDRLLADSGDLLRDRAERQYQHAEFAPGGVKVGSAAQSRRRRVLIPVMIAASVTAVVVGVTVYGPLRGAGSSSPAVAPADGPVPTSSAASSPTSGKPLARAAKPYVEPKNPDCGSKIPVKFNVPDGYQGPLPGPAKGAPGQVAPGQLIVHWSGPNGDLDARWPGDYKLEWALSNDPMYTNIDPTRVPRVAGSAFVDTPKGVCQSVGVAFYGLPPKGSDARGMDAPPLSPPPPAAPARDARGNFLSTPTPIEVTPTAEDAFLSRSLYALVASPESVQQVTATKQVGSVGNVHSEKCKRSGQLDKATTPGTPVAATPEDAVTAFLNLDPAGNSRFARYGYTKLVASDGSVALAMPLDSNASKYVTVFWLEKVANGYRVSRWEASGC